MDGTDPHSQKIRTQETDKTTSRRPYMPGEMTPAQRLAQIIRVDHAGEYGAKRIYQGQLAVLGNKPVAPTLRHMAEQEQEHLSFFEDQLVKHRVRPSLLFPLWHVGGYAMGAACALLGEKAAMACTVAVETVIDEHYEEQLQDPVTQEAGLSEPIEKFQAEELEHKQTGLDHGAEQATAYPLLSAFVTGVTKLAVETAKRI